MMIIVNMHGKDENKYISGSYNGVPFGVSYDEVKYQEMKKLEEKVGSATSMEELRSIIEEFEPLTKESYKEKIETKCPWVYVNRHTNKFYLKLPNGKISSKPLPKQLVDRMLESTDKGIDVMPLVKFWIRVLRNPHYTDHKGGLIAWYINERYTNQELAAKLVKDGLHPDVASARATTYQTPITGEGLLCTYKVVEEIDWKFILDEEGKAKRVDRYKPEVDEISGLITYKKPEYAEDFLFEPCVMHRGGDEFFSGDKPGHVIRVGFSHWLDNWDKIDTNDHHAGVKGIHAGNQDYIRCFQRAGTVTINCFIDPMDIGAVVQDRTGALRVKRFFAHSIFSGTNRSLYHSSDYAKRTDEEYRQMLADDIVKTGELKDGADEELEEKKALID